MMKALTVRPGRPDDVELSEVPDPDEAQGSVLVEGLAIGICGTDLEIVAGQYGEAPAGADRLILGHESLGRVLQDSSGRLSPGELVVGFVRHPDPVPCANCAVGEWDMCSNGRYTEHGIKQMPGFGAQRYRLQPDRLVRLDPALESTGMLLEPTSILAKAWEVIERIGARSHGTPRRVLVTGAGPIGLLAALLGVQRGLEVHVLDQVTDGPKPGLVRDLGATYHLALDTAPTDVDIVIECTGVAQLVFDVMGRTAYNGIVCLTGVSSGGRTLSVDGGAINRELVLENDVVFGSVNANGRHYEAAATALAAADANWLSRLITRRVPLSEFGAALEQRPGDVKVVLELKDDDA